MTYYSKYSKYRTTNVHSQGATINSAWGRILGRNLGKILKSLPPCYSQLPLHAPNKFTLPPLSKSGLKTEKNENKIFLTLSPRPRKASQDTQPAEKKDNNKLAVIYYEIQI